MHVSVLPIGPGLADGMAYSYGHAFGQNIVNAQYNGQQRNYGFVEVIVSFWPTICDVTPMGFTRNLIRHPHRPSYASTDADDL